ncbi:MAG: LPS-assembly protein LptD, partial [Spirochaetales bacterium]|nr:LPS-assembly protein LptD [Spirochaetales bacterium]
QETLLLDIQTTNYYDLVLWAEKLGLESNGSIDDLRKILFTHYEIEAPNDTKEIQSGRSIIIEAARELNYIENITIEQNYILLQGEVVLEMIDYDNNTSHKIKADNIVFNETEKTISASGNIIYEIIKADKSEYFYGKSLVFEIDSWEGIFFEGVSETTRLVEDKELSSSENINFFFSGENIYRGSGDRIELNKGSITSSKIKDPYYRLDADKIWILQPGEWALKNATLYVGRIPVFYFPFFFLPGDELIFNPTVGYKEIEGYFINTTSYLIGLKEEESDDTFSFLKSENVNQGLKENYREGLFLRTSDKDLDINLWPYNNNSYLKLYLDYYSRKGYFIGLDGKLIFDSFLESINFFTGLSYSKYIYLDTKTDVYTPLRINSSGSYVYDHEKTYFFGQSIPFRFAFDIEMAFKTSWATLNIDLPLYSDNKYRANFLNREEGLKWVELINNDEKDIDNKEKEMSSLIWYINGSFNPSFEALSPVVDNLSIDKLNTNLNWLSRVRAHPEEQLLNNNNYIYDDALSFYYPSSLILPDFSGRISGTFFQTQEPAVNSLENNLKLEDKELLRDPFTEDIEIIPVKESDSLVETPVLLDFYTIELIKEKDIFSNLLTYSIIPSFTINSIFNSNIPESENDISFESDYSIFTAQTTSSLDYSFNIFDTFLDFNNISILSMNYKEHFDPTNQTAVWDSYLLQDNNATNYKITDKITIISKPFTNNEVIKGTAFTYNLNTTLYNRFWNTTDGAFQDNYFIWDEESINDHRASIEFKIEDNDNYQILKLDTVLPPQNIELYPEIIFHAAAYTGSIKTEFHFIEALPNNYWVYKPYEGYIQYDFY